jgi:hypothetical protein
MTDALNPAAKLHERLKEWRVLPQGKTPKEVRTPDGGDWVGIHMETLDWFCQVRARLTGRQYAEVLDRYASAIFAGEIGIDGSRGNSHTHFLSAADLLPLSVLAENWGDPGFSAADLSEFFPATEAVRELIGAADYLDEDSARYLIELSQALDKAVTEFSIFGTEGVRRLADELIGALATLFADAPPEDAEKARGLIGKIGSALRKVLRLGAAPAIEGTVAGAVQAITTGLQ